MAVLGGPEGSPPPSHTAGRLLCCFPLSVSAGGACSLAKKREMSCTPDAGATFFFPIDRPWEVPYCRVLAGSEEIKIQMI